MLDGWRAFSILAVLAAHLLPLGPARLQINLAAGNAGMGLFFGLSGFLIASTLNFHPSVRDFAIRRAFRILPVAWLFSLVTFPFAHAPASSWLANLFFYANNPPYHMVPIAGHLWSLCVEVQFYAGISILFLVLRERSLALLPFLCVAVTLNRILAGESQDIATLYRIDDILAGAALGYLFHSRHAPLLRRSLEHLPPAIPVVLLCVASHPAFLRIGQLRAYFAVAAIGATLFQRGSRFNRLLESKPLAYLATISYALYIWHPLTTHGWFDPPSKAVKYLRRPVGIALSVALAHLSTHTFEGYFLRAGKRLVKRLSSPARPIDAVPANLPTSLPV